MAVVVVEVSGVVVSSAEFNEEDLLSKYSADERSSVGYVFTKTMKIRTRNNFAVFVAMQFN